MPEKIRGRVLTMGYRRGDVMADWTMPEYKHNSDETAWCSEWVAETSGVVIRYTKTGATKAAATPASSTDGLKVGVGD
jgi:hypothetical protein